MKAGQLKPAVRNNREETTEKRNSEVPIVNLKGYCRRDLRDGFKSQLPKKLMTEEGSACLCHSQLLG